MSCQGYPSGEQSEYDVYDMSTDSGGGDSDAESEGGDAGELRFKKKKWTEHQSLPDRSAGCRRRVIALATRNENTRAKTWRSGSGSPNNDRFLGQRNSDGEKLADTVCCALATRFCSVLWQLWAAEDSSYALNRYVEESSYVLNRYM